MITDNELMFSKAQAITAAARSTNVIDLTGSISTSGAGAGRQLFAHLQIDEAFATASTVRIQLQTDGDVAFGSPATIYDSGTVSVAALPVGYKLNIPLPPTGVERYVSFLYTPNTNASAGKITAGIVMDVDAPNYPPLA